MPRTRFLLPCFATLFASIAFADFHTYVAGYYEPYFVEPPSSMATYNPATGEFGKSSFVPPGGVQAIASPDGSQIWIIGITPEQFGAPGFISIVDTATQAVATTFSLPDVTYLEGCPTQVCPVGVFSPDGALMYVVEEQTNSAAHLLVYNVASRRLMSDTTLVNIAANSVSVAISPDGSQLFVAGGNITVIDTSTLQITATIRASVQNMAASGNTLLACSTGSNTLLYIDMTSHQTTASVTLQYPALQISVSQSGNAAVLFEQGISSSSTTVFQTVDVAAKTVSASASIPAFTPFAISPDGTQVTVPSVYYGASASSVGVPEIETFASDSLSVVQHTPTLAGAIPVYAGGTLFLYMQTNELSVVDGETGAVTQTFPIGGSAVTLAAPGAGLVYAFTGAGTDIIDGTTGKIGRIWNAPYSLSNQDYNGASRKQIYAYEYNQLLAINSLTGSPQGLAFPDFPLGPGCVEIWGTPVVSPNQAIMILNGNQICGGGDGRKQSAQGEPTDGLGIYDTSTNAVVALVVVPNSAPPAFSPDSKLAYVPCCSMPAQISVVDLASGKVTQVWNLPDEILLGAIAVSPDGATIYAVANDGYTGPAGILVISTATGSVTKVYPAPVGSQTSIGVSPDGAKLMMSSLSGEYGESLGAMDTQTGAISYTSLGYDAGPLVVTN